MVLNLSLQYSVFRTSDIAWGVTGFGRAKEYTAAVVQRVLDTLTNQPGLSSDPTGEAVIQWLKGEIAPTAA